MLVVCFAGHPVHVSVCNVSYNPRTKHMELVQHIFLNDLEETLRHYSQDPYLDVVHPKDPLRFDSLLQAYYLEKVALEVNKKQHTLHYLGHARKADKMHSYLESRKKIRRTPKHISLRNGVLFEQYSDQQNIINLQVGNVKKSMLLTRKTPHQAVAF